MACAAVCKALMDEPHRRLTVWAAEVCGIWVINDALYTLCLILFSAPTAIYSAIYTVFNALFVDRVHQQNITTQVLIVTKLRDLEPFWELGRKMDRGITYWTGHGAYTGDEVQMSRVGPSATMSPSAITSTRSVAAAANSTSWVLTTTVVPASARPRSMDANRCFAS